MHQRSLDDLKSQHLIAQQDLGNRLDGEAKMEESKLIMTMEEMNSKRLSERESELRIAIDAVTVSDADRKKVNITIITAMCISRILFFILSC